MTEPVPAAGERYVYYRVPVATSEAAAEQILAAQQRLRQQMPGLTTRLLRRADVTQDAFTWMEVYHHPDGLNDVRWAPLQTALALLPSTRQGPRHEEHFVPQD